MDTQSQEILSDSITQSVMGTLGISDMNADQQSHIMADVGDVISNAVMVSILRMIPEERREDFGKALAKNDIETVTKLLNTYIPDVQTYISDIVRSEMQLLIGEVEESLTTA